MNTEILFWDVDTQLDFIDTDGNLPVPGASRIRPNLRKLTEYAVENDIPILSTADTHVEDDPEFEQFPPHCIGGTPGHAKIAETLLDGASVLDTATLESQAGALGRGEIPQLVLEKHQLDPFDEEYADRCLEQLQPEKVVLYGVATEFCVRLSGLGLLERDYRVDLVEDAIKGIEDEDARQAKAEMQEKGADLVGTDDVTA